MIIFFRRKLAIILIFTFIFGIINNKELIFAKETDLNLYAHAYAVIDGNNGRVLFEKDGDKELANASTTKILTCIIILENCDLNKYFKASKTAIKQPEVKLGVKLNEKYKIKDMLYAMMLESYNDCAVVLAEGLSGSLKEFSDLMNKKAKEIGCNNSYFMTPNGLDKKEENDYHHSTANDLCKIIKYCTWDSHKSKEFKKITEKREYSFEVGDKKYKLYNHNNLLSENIGNIAGKTGFTSKAGYCYVGSFEINNKKICIALLACGWPNNKNYKWYDSKKIIKYVDENYEIYKENDNQFKDIYIDNYHSDLPDIKSWKKEIPISIEVEEIKNNYLIASDEKIDQYIKIDSFTKSSYRKGEAIGNIIYKVNNSTLCQKKLFINQAIKRWNYKGFFVSFIKEFISI